MAKVFSDMDYQRRLEERAAAMTPEDHARQGLQIIEGRFIDHLGEAWARPVDELLRIIAIATDALQRAELVRNPPPAPKLRG